jgi:hypothetical protein
LRALTLARTFAAAVGLRLTTFFRVADFLTGDFLRARFFAVDFLVAVLTFDAARTCVTPAGDAADLGVRFTVMFEIAPPPSRIAAARITPDHKRVSPQVR